MGYVYMILSLTSFGFIGICAKLADMRGCKPVQVFTLAYAWCALFGAAFVALFRGADFKIPLTIYAIAVPFGIASVIGGMVFLAGIRYGKISTSWLIINLSAAIPAVGSVVIYREHVNTRKIAVLALAVIAIFLLWKDKQLEEVKQLEVAAGEETV